MNKEIYEEIMAPRRRLWEKGGGTLHGVCEYLRKCEAERTVRRVADLQTAAGIRIPMGETQDLARKGEKGE